MGRWLIPLVLLLLLIGCGEGVKPAPILAPTYTPYPTYTPPPTHTPYPTLTPAPTYTPLPTSSPVATLKPSPESVPTTTPHWEPAGTVERSVWVQAGYESEELRGLIHLEKPSTSLKVAFTFTPFENSVSKNYKAICGVGTAEGPYLTLELWTGKRTEETLAAIPSTQSIHWHMVVGNLASPEGAYAPGYEPGGVVARSLGPSYTPVPSVRLPTPWLGGILRAESFALPTTHLYSLPARGG